MGNLVLAIFNYIILQISLLVKFMSLTSGPMTESHWKFDYYSFVQIFVIYDVQEIFFAISFPYLLDLSDLSSSSLKPACQENILHRSAHGGQNIKIITSIAPVTKY